MVGTLLGILEAGLSIWASREKTKYQDRYIKLKREWYEEYNKPEDRRSDAELDRIEFDIRVLCLAVSAQIRAENTSPK